MLLGDMGICVRSRNFRTVDIRYQNWKNIPLPYIPDHYELKLLGNNTKQYNVIKNIFNKDKSYYLCDR